MRADARRNRELILDAARALVAEGGPDATMDRIAAVAGVAVGTLYRHFPAKEDLVAAVVLDSVERMATDTEAAMQAVTDGADADPVLADLLGRLAARHQVDRAFKQAAGRLDAAQELATAEPGSPVHRVMTAVTDLLEAAKRAGALRADVTVADLVMLLGAVPDGDDARRSRYVEIVLAGLRP